MLPGDCFSPTPTTTTTNTTNTHTGLCTAKTFSCSRRSFVARSRKWGRRGRRRGKGRGRRWGKGKERRWDKGRSQLASRMKCHQTLSAFSLSMGTYGYAEVYKCTPVSHTHTYTAQMCSTVRCRAVYTPHIHTPAHTHTHTYKKTLYMDVCMPV